MFAPKTILHPTDLSRHSAYALSIACDLARQNNAKLLVLYVVESLGPENVTYGEAVSQLQPAGYRTRLEQYLKDNIPAEGALSMYHILSPGDPAREIERVAKENAVDLIVMGTHGHTGLARLLMGSVAEHVVRRAPCPVLTTKIPPEN
jgi:nucleotide-binding universal stress UspA family protein